MKHLCYHFSYLTKIACERISLTNMKLPPNKVFHWAFGGFLFTDNFWKLSGLAAPFSSSQPLSSNVRYKQNLRLKRNWINLIANPLARTSILRKGNETSGDFCWIPDQNEHFNLFIPEVCNLSRYSWDIFNFESFCYWALKSKWSFLSSKFEKLRRSPPRSWATHVQNENIK